MECQECNENPATLHFTKILNGQKTEMHLCEQCAREKGEAFQGTGGFSFNNLLSGLLNFEYPIGNSPNETQEDKVLECGCGLTYEAFSKKGRFGCAECYETFSDKLQPILRRVHSGNTKHGGKIPKRIGGNIHIRKEINKIREQLQQCIKSEEFEKAAELRDEIRTLEQKLNAKGEGEE